MAKAQPIEGLSSTTEFRVAIGKIIETRFDEMMRVSATPDLAERLRAVWGRIDIRPHLAAVTVPTLVAHARDERVIPFEEGRILAVEDDGAVGAVPERRGGELAERDGRGAAGLVPAEHVRDRQLARRALDEMVNGLRLGRADRGQGSRQQQSNTRTCHWAPHIGDTR